MEEQEQQQPAASTPPGPLNLWSVTEGQRYRYALAILAMAATNLFLFSAPLVGKYAIDVVVAGDFTAAAPVLGNWAQRLDEGQPVRDQIASYLWLSAGFALIMTCIGGLFMFVRGLLAAQASEQIVQSLRMRIYGHLHDLPAAYYDTADTGDLVQRSSSDVETLRVFLASDVIEIGRACMLVLCVVPLLFWLDTRLAWLSLVLMPFLVIGAYLFFKRVQTVFQLTDEAEAAMTGTLQENLTGNRVVRAFARQEYEINKFGDRNATFRNNNHRLIRLMGGYWGISDFFAMSQIGIVLLFGAQFVLSGTLSIGTLFAFMTYESMVIWPVRQLGRVLTDSGKAVVSLGRINEVITKQPEPQRAVPSFGRSRGALELSHLSFSYGSEPVLRDLSLRVEPGESLGIVGPPGCGKSSLIRVLLGLYPYQQGSATLDGLEISQVDRHWLRQQISVVLQDPFLYSRTIMQNLVIGRPGATEEDIHRATKDAAMLATIKHLDGGFDAMVGERGVTLSGGQRQRLALARALLKDPPILVLDDALSAVDTSTEAQILAALEQRKGLQTTLVISHRLSSLRQVDRILVLDNGAIAQLGTHAELMNEQGPYQALVALQQATANTVAADVMASHRTDS